MPELVASPVRSWALRLLPPFPAVAYRVLALVSDEDVAARQISEIIRLDPTFTAEILRVANSALFGLAGEIAAVRVAWRLADVLGFAAFPPDRSWSQQERLDLIPGVPATWMAGDLDAVQAQVRSRLNAYTA